MFFQQVHTVAYIQIHKHSIQILAHRGKLKCTRTHRFTSLIFFFLNYCIPLKTRHTVIKKTEQNKAKGGEKKAGFGKADVRTSQANV